MTATLTGATRTQPNPRTPTAPGVPGRWLGGGWGDRDHPVEHVKYRIANSPVLGYPYQHQVVTDVFPADYYAAILEHMPAPDQYRALIKDYPKRGTVELTDAGAVEALPAGGQREFWKWFVGAFSAPAFMHFALEQYAPSLVGRFRDSIRPLMFLFRDAGGYAIGPHTDSFKKVVTMLFYLPADRSQLEFGTSVCVPRDPANPPRHEGHGTWSDYRSVKTAAFEPNSLFSFAVTDRSYHAVRPTPPGTVRNSLQYFLVVD